MEIEMGLEQAAKALGCQVMQEDFLRIMFLNITEHFLHTKGCSGFLPGNGRCSRA